jgi:DNA-binding transcriptional MerR regulator
MASAQSMLTVSKLARKFGLSRETILYYEREGLLEPAYRADNGYRWYGEREIWQLQKISSYRSYGVPVSEIRDLLERESDQAVEEALRRRFDQLELDIQALRRQQKSLLAILEHTGLGKGAEMSKERWSQIMQAAGMSDEDMRHWHCEFEAREPRAHQEFLESLNIDPSEVTEIRKWSRRDHKPA